MSAALSSIAAGISGGISAIASQAGSSQPRGLHNFILEVRNSTNKDDERSRVDKELANIRQKFANSSSLNSYQKKKYVWKMCYIHMLGYEIDFGHLEFISLLSSSKFQEKAVGYMAISLMLKPGDELITLIINSIRNDIVSNNHAGQTLALSAVANIGGSEFSEALTADVSKYAIPPSNHLFVAAAGIDLDTYMVWQSLISKKAVLCLLRLFRNAPDSLDLSDWEDRILTLLTCSDMGIVTSSLSLLTAFASLNPTQFQSTVPTVVNVLAHLAVKRECSEDYRYYKTPSPWIQVKCLKFLQYYPLPTDQRTRELLIESIHKVLIKSDLTEGVNKLNAENSVLFEAVNLIISLGADLDADLRTQALSLLGKYIGLKDANIRFLGLCSMAVLVRLSGPDDVLEHLATVIDACKDADVSVAKKALDLLFVMTLPANVEEVIAELLVLLLTAPDSLKEELVVKIAILTEKYSTVKSWYVDTLVQVVLSAGDFVSEDVWFRVVQVVTNHPEVQEYASSKLLTAVQSKVAHETTVTLAGYILGEFGVSISGQPESSGYDQFSALHHHFVKVGPKTQALLLTAYAKLMNLYPDTKPAIEEVFTRYSTSPVLELQQRACEYLMLTKLGSDVVETVLNSMPTYSMDKENLLLSRLGKGEKESTDRAWHATAKADEEPEADKTMLAMTPAAPRTKTADLLSLDSEEEEDKSIGLSSPVQTIVLTASEEAESKKRNIAFSRVTSGQRGVILDTDVVTIAATAEFRAHQGRIAIFITNKSNYGISQLSVTLPVDGVVSIKKQDPPSAVAAAEEAKLLLAVECLKPFADPPSISLKFTIGNMNYFYMVPLPLSIASFMEPIAVEKSDYMVRWKSLEGEDREAQEVFTGSPNLAVSAELMASVRSSLFPALHLGLATGLDSDTTATACCSLRTGTLGQDGATLVSVGAMIRLEADVANRRYRVTVRAKHPAVALALKTLVKSHLG